MTLLLDTQVALWWLVGSRRLGGHYEKLWRHQSGGYLAPDLVAAEKAVEPPAAPLTGEDGEVAKEPSERARV